MRKSTITSITLVGAVALTLFAAAPANAAAVIPDATNGVNVVVIPGTFTISSLSAGAATNDVTPNANGVAVGGMTSTVLVTDARAAASSWVASVKASAFSKVGTEVDTAANSSMAGAFMTYTPSGLTKVGTSNALADGVLTLTTTPQSAVTALATSGFNTATWVGNISVTIPAAALLGTYTATITHSIL